MKLMENYENETAYQMLRTIRVVVRETEQKGLLKNTVVRETEQKGLLKNTVTLIKTDKGAR